MFFPKLSQIATSKVITVDDQRTIQQAVHCMHEHQIRDVIVTGESGLRILTAKELIEFRVLNIDFETPLYKTRLNVVPQLSPEDSVIDGLNVIKNHPDEHLCLVDAKKQLIGIVSYSDLASCLDPQHLAQTRSIGELVRLTRIVRVRPEDSIETVLLTLNRVKQAAAIVVDEGAHPIGIITQSDIIDLLDNHLDTKSPVSDAMTSPLVTFLESMTLSEALTLSRSKKIKRLVVVDDENRISGILHQKDLVALVYQEWSDLLQRQRLQLKSERDLFAGGPVSVIIWRPEAGWPVEFVSTNIKNMLGYEAEMFSHPDFRFINLMHTDDVKRVSKEVAQYVGEHRSFWEQTYRLIDKSGDTHWVYDYTRAEYSSEGELTKLYGYLLDQTDQIRTQDQLEYTKERFSAVVNQTGQVIWEIDSEGLYSYISPAVEKVLGYRADELIGKLHYYDLHPLEGREAFKNDTLAMLNQGVVISEFENIAVHKDGYDVWLSTSGTPVYDEHGRVSGYRGVDNDISERKKNEQRIIANEDRLRSVLEATHTGIWSWNLATGEVVWSDECYQQLGLTRENFKPSYQTVMGLLQNKDLDVIQSDIQQQTAQQGGYVVQFHFKHAQHQGDVWIEAKGRVLSRNQQGDPEILAGTHLDITTQKLAEIKLMQREAALEQQKQQYLDLVESHPYFINRYLPDTTNIFVNKALAEYFGYTPEQMIGFRWITTLTAEKQVEAQEGLSRCTIDNPTVTFINHVPRADGELRYIKWHNRAFFNDQGQLTHFQSVGFDVTEQLEAEDAIQQARQEAEAANRAKSDFLANMSHEIRTPMNAILGMSELALQQELSPKARSQVNKILQSGRSLLGIINDILDFSKIESGHLEIEQRPFYLDSVLDQLDSLFSDAAKQKGLHLLWELDPHLERAYKGDELRLRQVLTNLIGNAVKFTQQGNVRLAIRLVSQTDQQACLSFKIEDNGIGMDAQQVAQLFQPFTQADSSITRTHGGTGLGLVISQRLIKAMGSDGIQVRSEPKQGSAFSFELPLLRCSEQEHYQLQQGMIELTKQTKRLAGQVLLVEDNEINQEIAQAMLKNMGLSVTLAANGQQAVELACEQDFDAILMDIQMPVLDGYSATLAIREFDQAVPIIALTAAAMIEDRDKAMKVGMNAHLGKPIDSGQLYYVLEPFLTHDSSATLSPQFDAGDLPSLEGFDLAQGIAQLQGNQKLYQRLLAQFAEQLGAEFSQLPTMLRQLNETDKDQAWSNAQTLAHGLKGVAANLGAKAIAELASHIDLQLKQQQPILMRSIKALETALDQAQSEIVVWLAAVNQESTVPDLAQTQKLDQAQLQAEIQSLIAAAQASEYIDSDRIAVLFNQLPESFKSYQPKLQQALEKFDFEQVQYQLDTLSQALSL